jgi:GNAT superfamily N-acetyltransferase
MSPHIRPYRAQDRADVLTLSLRAWEPVFEKLRPAVQPFVYEAFYPNGWEARQTSDIAAFLNENPAHVWLATREDVLTGCVGIRLHKEDNMGEIYILAVDPIFQRHGIASALLDHALAQIKATGMGMVMVETGDDSGHAPSRAAYESKGFSRWPVARYFKEL